LTAERYWALMRACKHHYLNGGEGCYAWIERALRLQALWESRPR
jgi:hypothetical protein